MGEDEARPWCDPPTSNWFHSRGLERAFVAFVRRGNGATSSSNGPLVRKGDLAFQSNPNAFGFDWKGVPFRGSLWKASFETGSIPTRPASTRPRLLTCLSCRITCSIHVSIVCGPRRMVRFRWAVHVGGWEPSPEAWSVCEAALNEQEVEEVRRFKRNEDRKRAIVSRLLQRKAAREGLGLMHQDVSIKRTKGRKPFVASVDKEQEGRRKEAPNFNFNISHEGNYVVLASEPLCVTGCDVAAPEQHRLRSIGEKADDFFKSFTKVLSEMEWKDVHTETGDTEKLDVFRQHWSLKEAYTKALGVGVAFDLGKAEFAIRRDEQKCIKGIELHIDGKRQDNCSFSLHRLGDHWVSVARCPPQDIVDAHGEFRGTFKLPSLHDLYLRKELTAEQPEFVLMSVAELLPDHLKKDYEMHDDDLF